MDSRTHDLLRVRPLIRPKIENENVLLRIYALCLDLSVDAVLTATVSVIHDRPRTYEELIFNVDVMLRISNHLTPRALNTMLGNDAG